MGERFGVDEVLKAFTPDDVFVAMRRVFVEKSVPNIQLMNPMQGTVEIEQALASRSNFEKGYVVNDDWSVSFILVTPTVGKSYTTYAMRIGRDIVPAFLCRLGYLTLLFDDGHQSLIIHYDHETILEWTPDEITNPSYDISDTLVWTKYTWTISSSTTNVSWGSTTYG